MAAFRFLFLLAAFICFLASAFTVRSRWSSRINLIGLGLAFWVFVLLIEALTVLS